MPKTPAQQPPLSPTDETDDDDADDSTVAGVVENTLVVTWTEPGVDDTDPVVRVTLEGRLDFVITELLTPEGQEIYRSGLFKTDQDDMRDAIAVALKNGVNRAFTAAWNVVHPPEQRRVASRQKLEDKVAHAEATTAKMKVVQAELMDALLSGRAPLLANLAAHGVTPDDLPALGVSPAVFGDAEGN